MTYKISIKFDEPVYWPFWPFKTRRVAFTLPAGFQIEVDQTSDRGSWLTPDNLSCHPVTLSGHLSSDGKTMTTTVDFKEGSRLKRITKSP